MPKNTSIAHFIGNSTLGFIQFSESLDVTAKIITLCASTVSLLMMVRQAFPNHPIVKAISRKKPTEKTDNKSE